MPGLHASTRLGDLLVKKGKISHQQLFDAIRFQQNRRQLEVLQGIAPSAKNELGAILIELGFISRKQLRNSLSWQRRLRKATLVMTFFAPLLTVACGGGGADSSSSSLEVAQVTSSVSSLVSSYSSTASSPDARSFSSSSVSSKPQSSSSSSSKQQNLSSSSIAQPSVAGSVLIMWSPPTRRQNGDYLDITELGGYELRYKLTKESEYKSIRIANGYTDSYYFDYLKGDYVFEIAAYDSTGLFSDFVLIKKAPKR